ncbi:MAG: hypothetical protein A3B70_04360 [Deltaproteobacteria bacterium RIFCSPHIGHO2_02_FULL_40_11]|nr:MAG: hypothetical protein A3B70_04360 [Deltaproteobacteria bacterium RIFCSPHIGHO2_02_FULL_40_11]
MRRGLAVLFCSLGMVFAGNAVSKSEVQSSYFVPGEILVKFKGHVSDFSIQGIGMHQFVGAEVLRSYTLVRGLQHVRVVNPDIEEALRFYNNHPMVEYAEPNYIYSINRMGPLATFPNDPLFSDLWGLRNTGQKDANGNEGFQGADINMVEAWKSSVGNKNIIVGIVDTGVDYTHEDLKENIWTNTAEIPGNEIDDDQNGYVDDIHGWDAYNDDGDPMDDHNHGTHVSGTIAGVGNNAKGVIGVAPNVSLMGAKFLSANGSGQLSDAVEAIDYAVLMGAKVLNNSWGGGGYSQTLYDAIENAHKKGVIFVAAAGNSTLNNDYTDHYPSSYELPNVIAVGATTNRDELASFSNYGMHTVHVAAPGNAIMSTVIGNKYAAYSGTSMATPHVAGVVALLLDGNPGFTVEEIKERLISTSDDIVSLRRRVIAGGRVNAYNAIHNIIPPLKGPKDPGDWQEVEKEVSTPHNYPNNSKLSWTLSHPGATHLKLYFKKIETEEGYDVIKVKNKNGEMVDFIDGKFDGLWSFIVLGDTVHIEFESDATIQKYGFEINKYAFSERSPLE